MPDLIDFRCINQLTPPKRVRVYRNLHKKCFSIVDAKTGRVIAHRPSVVLRDARFHVRQAGRLKVIATRRKNVHAFVTGLMYETNFGFPDIKPKVAWYNPYITTTFINKRSRKPVQSAKVVLLAEKIFYWS